MSPITHLLMGWAVANTAGLDKRGRVAVTVAGTVPDIDGLGIVAELITRNNARPLLWWSQFHHVLAHNIGFGLAVACACFLASARRWTSAVLGLAAFHLHLICDVVGARGPEGEQWPVPYLLPFSGELRITWDGQWAINAWPNFVITSALLALMFFLAYRRGYSPLEMVSARADGALVRTLRERFGGEK